MYEVAVNQESLAGDDLIQGRDFVVISLAPFDYSLGNNCNNIAVEFAKHNRVLYVNRPLDRITAYKERHDPKVQKRLEIIKGKQNDIVEISENLWNLYPKTMVESINWMGSHRMFRYMNKMNNERLAKEILSAVKRLGFNDIIFFNDSDIFRSFHMDEMLKLSRYVYYIRDNLIALPYWKKHGEKMEAELAAKADVVVANSTYLADYGRKFNDKSYYVGQGCDISHFNEALIDYVPKDIASIGNPIIGYVGALVELRLDIDLLVKVAKARPDWNLVLVGPEDEAFQKSELHYMKNVYFLGRKKPEELPAYVNAFDVCINPQAVNPVTIGNYPRKIDEYLAMGKPTVATKTRAMEVFAEHTYLGSSAEEYVKLITLALNENTHEKKLGRKAFAATHTWENNVKEIYRSIMKTY